MKFITGLLILMLTGCVSLSDYCEEHPQPCVVAGTVAVAVIAGSIAIAASHNSVVVVKNPPPAGK